MQHAGAGQGDFDRLAGQLIDKREVFVVDRLGPVKAGGDADAGCTDGLAGRIGIVPSLFRIAVEFEPADPFEEMRKIGVPPKLAVGNDFETGILL